MTNENRTPDEIEREIETQRSELNANLEGLQDKFSVDTLIRQIGDQFREHGGDMGRSISDQVKANPIPLALTGIGLAWMMFGSPRSPASAQDRVEEDFRRSRRDLGRPYTPPVAHVRVHGTGPSWARDDDDDGGPGYGERMAQGAHAAKDTARRGADAVRSGASGAASSVHGAASSAKSSVRDAASSASSSVQGAAASARSSVAAGAQSVQDSVAAAGNRIAEGTENLTEEGRQRVIAARRKAIEMKRATMRSAGQGVDAASDFYDRQPLVVGALALAVGAALGGALPRTRVEDEYLGEHSDRLYDEAERIFEEEKTKAMKVASSLKGEAEDIAAETKAGLDSDAPGQKTAAQAVGDKAKSAADRMADTAKTAARDEKLGKPTP